VQSNPISLFQPKLNKAVNSSEFIQPNTSFQVNKNFNHEKKKMGYSYLPIPGDKFVENGLKSPEIKSKPQSPKARQL